MRCWQAGTIEDVGDAGKERPAAGGASNEQLSRFMVCLVESSGPASGAQGDTELGLVAVETSTGAVMWDQFRWEANSMPCRA